MEGNDGYVVPLASFVADERNTDVLRPYGIFAVIAPFNFPAALSVGMAASRADRRQHGGVQAVRGDAVDRRRSWPRSSPPPSSRPASSTSCTAARPTGRALVDAPRRRRRLHRLGRGGPRDRAQDAGRPLRAPGPDRDGRQEPGHRHRPRRPRQGGRGRGPRRLRPRRAEVQRVLAGDRRARRARRLRRAAGGVDARACPSAIRPIARASWGRSSTRPASRASRPRSRRARRDGAVAAGGGRPARPGHFVEPTVVCGLPLGHPLERDELFLPSSP